VTPPQDGGGRRPALPRGPQALPREQVAADQRERLFAAMVQAVNERGFLATTISDLTAGAGVSRRSFYEHFANKEDCLLATYDAIVERLTRRLSDAVASAGEGWREQLEAFIRALFEGVVERPDAARLVCVEMAAAGPVGIERWAQGAALLERFIGAVFERDPGPGTVPEPIARAIVGALRKILYSRVRTNRSRRALKGSLMKVVPDLMDWIAAYYPAPAGLSPRPRSRRLRPLPTGRAPGTLTLPPRRGARGLPSGEHNLPRGFVVYNQRERIFDAIANLTAAGGYPALGIEEIAAEAAVSLATFYEHFANKEEAFLATYEVGHARAVAAATRALDFKLTLAENVSRGAAALLEFLAAEPSYAHLACVDVVIAHPHVAGRLDEANSSYAALLDLGREQTALALPAPIVGEAIVGGVFELLHDQILQGRTRRLPELTDHVAYIALAPFIGGEAAWAAISGR